MLCKHKDHSPKLINSSLFYYVTIVLLQFNISYGFEINIPFNYNLYIKKIDPLKIQGVQDYFLNQHLHLSLIDGMNFETDQYIAIENLQWKKNDLHITLKKDLKDSKGDPIGPIDLYYSLLRHLKRGGASHGSLSKMLVNCEDNKCISYDEKNIILKCKYREDITKLFTQINFAIIPFKSLNHELEIVDLTRTAGPYFLEKDNHELTLKKNKFYHFPYKNIPSKINLKQINEKDGLNGNLDKYDIIPAIHTYQTENLPKGYDLFESTDLSLNQITITENGINSFTIGERVYFESLIIELIKNTKINYHNQIYKKTSSYSLTEQEMSTIQLKKIDKIQKPKRKIRLATSQNRYPYWIKKLKHPLIEIFKVKSKDDLVKADGVLYTMDVSYDSPASFINYVLKSGTWGLYGNDSKEILNNFHLQTEKGQRVKIIKDTTKKIYEEVRMIPLFRDTYKTVYKKGFKINFSKNDANISLWFITKKDEQ